MKNNLIIGIICILLLAGLVACNSKDKTASKDQIIEKQLKLSELQGVNYSITELSKDTVKYMKNKSKYKNLYITKKFALYFVGAENPNSELVINAITPIKNNTLYREKYNFYEEETSAGTGDEFENAEDSKASEEFMNACSQFCIVNPGNNQVFGISGISENETKQMNTIFENLKDW